MADGADAGAVTLGLNLRGECGTSSAVRVANKAQFNEIVGPEGATELGEKSGREALFADFNGRFEFLAEAAELGFLRAGEGKVFHVRKTHDRLGRRCKPDDLGFGSAGPVGRIKKIERQHLPLTKRERAEVERAEVRAM